MDNRMLERIVIIILLLLNLFLAAVVLSERLESFHSNAEIIQHVERVLSDNGITAAEGAVIVQAAPKRVTLVRNSQKEAELMGKLIGSGQAEEQGGNIMSYQGTKGKAVLRGNGEVAALYSFGAVPLRFGAEKTTKRLLNSAGLKAELTEPPAEGALSLSYYCCWNGCPVYNAVLTFDYYESGLNMITGSRVFDTVTAEDGTGLMDSVSALLRFVELIELDGIICSRLDAIRPGYLQSVVISGESSLTPVWRIETDTGVFLIHAETGAIVSAGT